MESKGATKAARRTDLRGGIAAVICPLACSKRAKKLGFHGDGKSGDSMAVKEEKTQLGKMPRMGTEVELKSGPWHKARKPTIPARPAPGHWPALWLELDPSVTPGPAQGARARVETGVHLAQSIRTGEKKTCRRQPPTSPRRTQHLAAQDPNLLNPILPLRRLVTVQS